MGSIDREAVYAEVRAIPLGTVITYGDLAERVGLTQNHARAIGNVLRTRPDNDAWVSTTPEDHDIPWWRVVKADGTLLSDDDENGIRWVKWARAALVAEGVVFNSAGRVASLANAGRQRSSGRSARSAASKFSREPEPCWRHDKVQYSCRDCTPLR